MNAAEVSGIMTASDLPESGLGEREYTEDFSETAAVPEKKALNAAPKKRIFLNIISRAVIFIGFAVIGVLAVPAVVLIALILAVWKGVDRLAAGLEETEDKEEF